MTLPVIDVGALVADRGDAERDEAATAIDRACRTDGFFYVVGHGIAPELVARLDGLARDFFARPDDEKAAIAMARGGRAWRGWFPVGGELTSGRPDRKEGIYFGAELGPAHPLVAAGVPMHGANLFPAEPAALRSTVLEYLDACTALGHALARGVSRGLGLADDWFARRLTGDPTILFRIFHYPAAASPDDGGAWGVGEHTDYGLLTILAQDRAGGLSVHTPRGWVDVPPIDGAFVINVGDMLERVTRGRYRSTPHRVRNTSGDDRVSSAFFFDPAWDADVQPVPDATRGDDIGAEAGTAARPRWDDADPQAFDGTYGDYLLGKVAKVFPDLGADVLPAAQPRESE